MDRLANTTRLFLLSATLVAVLSGCRQPVTNPQARSTLFDFNRTQLLSQRGANQRLANRGGFANSTFSNPFAGPFRNRNNGELANDELPNLDITPGEEVAGQMVRRVNDLNHQLGAFNADNQELYTQIANLQQQLQVANDYNVQLKQQLADTSGQFQQLQTARQSAEQRALMIQAQLNQAQQQAQQAQSQLASGSTNVPSQLPGMATVRANNSLLNKLNQIRIPGAEAKMDGDVIRVEFPTDNLIMPGSYQVQASRVAALQQLVGTIGQVFPKQIIGVEAHWDGTPLNPNNISHHQLTTTQALSVFNELQRLGLPENQMFVMGLGSNRPKYPNARSNKRIEIVIYPEEYGQHR